MTLINVIITVYVLYKPECIQTIKYESFFFGEQDKSRLDFRIFSRHRPRRKEECRYNINWTRQPQAIILHREDPCLLSGAQGVIKNGSTDGVWSMFTASPRKPRLPTDFKLYLISHIVRVGHANKYPYSRKLLPANTWLTIIWLDAIRNITRCTDTEEGAYIDW